MGRGRLPVTPELVTQWLRLPEGVEVLPNDDVGLYVHLIVHGPDDVIPCVLEGTELPEVSLVLKRTEDPSTMAYKTTLVKLDVRGV